MIIFFTHCSTEIQTKRIKKVFMFVEIHLRTSVINGNFRVLLGTFDNVSIAVVVAG
jgi:hypothetical protein